MNGTGSLVMNAAGEQIDDTAIVTFNDSARLDLSTGSGQPETVQTVQSASANASINLGTSGRLTIAPSSSMTYSNGGLGESDFSGSISDGGNGTVVMNGAGTYGMLGVNAVSKLIVNSGTLKVNGNSGTGAVTVNSGGTLLGQGTIAGPVTVAGGATIAAGFSAGLLTLAAGLNLSAGGNGSTNVWELAALKDSGTGVAGTDFDQIVLTGGTLALGAQATLDLEFHRLSHRTRREQSLLAVHARVEDYLVERRFQPGPVQFWPAEEWQLRGRQLHDGSRRERQHRVDLHPEGRAAGDTAAHHVRHQGRPEQRDGALYQYPRGHELHVGLYHEPRQHDQLVSRGRQDGGGYRRFPDRRFGYQQPASLPGLFSLNL